MAQVRVPKWMWAATGLWVLVLLWAGSSFTMRLWPVSTVQAHLALWLSLGMLALAVWRVRLLYAERQKPPEPPEAGAPAKHNGVVALHVVLIVVAVCAITLSGVGFYTSSVGDGTPAPPESIDDPTNPAHFRALLEYARGLPFDTAHPASDERWVTLKDTIRDSIVTPAGVEIRDSVVIVAGPRARLDPQKDAYLNSIGDLEGSGSGQGRVLARVWIDPDYVDPIRGRRGYRILPPGVSYLWVDNMRVQGDSGSARLIVIPDDPAGAVIVSEEPVRYKGHRPLWVNYSQARWIGDPGDDCMNDPCPHGCCSHCLS